MQSFIRNIIIVLIVLSAFACKRKWTEKNKSDFVSGCLSRQVKELGIEKARAYCSCLVEKVVRKYPNANDAGYIQYDSAIVRLAKDCLKHP
ncbi:MAG TPA: hypothetical protein VNR87_14990 [Flavisolibacter sp.]|nr:hypothetical protein [Flavisolibacter sp.]